MNDEDLIRDIDFQEFEEKFRLPTKEASKETLARQERLRRKRENQVLFVEVNRAKNMSKNAVVQSLTYK